MVLLCLLLAAWPGKPPQAAEVTGLYQATVPVRSREDERERQQAFGTALREVLVKLSGRTDTLQHPDVRGALGSVQTYVDSWAYRSLAPAQAEAAGSNIALDVAFFQPQLQALLDAAGIPVWPANRADTLLWIVEQDVSGQRSLLAGDSTVVQALRAEAAQRAMPLITPILDLQDRLALRPEILWELQPDAIRGASARYGTDSVLVLRILHLVSGDVIARAEHHLRGLVRETEVLEAPLAPFLTATIDLAARELAANYGVFASSAESTVHARVSVAGVDSVEDYAGMLRYLEGLAVVRSVQVQRADRDVVELSVAVGGQLRQLIEALALDRRLLPLADAVRTGQEFRLDYRWQGF